MTDKPTTEERMKENIISIINTMREVILNPAGFFRKMPRSGGFVEPIIFVASMSFIVGVINFILWPLDLGFATSFGMALLYVVIMPVFVVIFSFVGAAILFVIWKIMGSQESYETAYRCGAYAAAITPVTTIVGVVPYIGSVVGLVWMAYVIVSASIEVHGIKSKIAYIVFGAIFGLLLLMNISATYSARHFSSEMEQWQKTSQDFDKMTSEEKGEALGKFMKGMQKGIEKD
ncbi:MAG: YIP1 family protein [Thermodesulfobacteriota bacterium]|nr:YIP1 family protein [Thermodesulfobacteriota bacterium]